MAKTKAELEQEANEAATKAGEEYAKAQRESAEKERTDNPAQGETEDEYYARVNAARASGIFGDTETAIEQQVPSHDDEAASVAVAEKDATGQDASDDEARRQVDAASGVTGTAEEVNAKADEPNVNAEGTPDANADSTVKAEENTTATEAPAPAEAPKRGRRS